MRKLNDLISKTAIAILLVASLVFVADHNNTAQAEDTDLIKIPGSFSSSFAIVSEYRYRGLDQSDEHPALQGSFDWSHEKGYYLGVWGSNVDFNDGDNANTEFDIYGGITREYYGISFDLGILYYVYPGANEGLNYDFVEYYFGLGKEWEMLSLNASVNYAPQFYAGSGDATYMSYDAGVPLGHGLALSAHVGYQWLTDAAKYGVGSVDPTIDYLDYSVGLSYTTNGFDLSVTYVDTDLSKADRAIGADDTVVFGVSRSF
jgi:uncharacterized protein (TIGR02001 family)